jgi:hypothetical protein
MINQENMENDNISKYKENSIIQKLFDQFLIKPNILRIANQTSFTFTEWFFDSVILFLLFLVLFYFENLLIWGINSATLILIIIALFAIIEFIGANVTIFRRMFSSDEQTNKVLNNIGTIPSPKLEQRINELRFSPRCINKVLEMISDNPDKIPPYLFEQIITNQSITQENLNKLFTTKILLNIREEVIFNLFFRKRDKLTKQNIKTVIDNFSQNDRILKMLAATQKDSVELMINHPKKSEFNQLFNKYHIREEHIDIFMKINPVFLMKKYGKFASLAIGFILTITFFYFLFSPEMQTYASSTYTSLQYFFVALFGPWFLIGLFQAFISMPLLNRLWKNYYERFKNNVLNSSTASIFQDRT